jgi:hypothetical protein
MSKIGTRREKNGLKPNCNTRMRHLLMTYPISVQTALIRRPLETVCALLLACVMLQACSPKGEESGAASTGGGGDTDAVVIVREKQHDYPLKFAATMREIQDRCLAGKSVIAAAQGWAFDSAAEHLTDEEIAALDSERTEEYFYGKKYAKVITGAQFDFSKISATREGSCKPTPKHFKSVEIQDEACNVVSIEYDLADGTGRREEIKGVCNTPESPALQEGEPVAIAGSTVQCKWSPPGPLITPECTLIPSSVHAGTGRLLVAIRKMPDHLRLSTTPMPGTVAFDMQSLATTEQALLVTVGAAIPAEKFSAPADSLAFPLTQ